MKKPPRKVSFLLEGKIILLLKQGRGEGRNINNRRLLENFFAQIIFPSPFLFIFKGNGEEGEVPRGLISAQQKAPLFPQRCCHQAPLPPPPSLPFKQRNLMEDVSERRRGHKKYIVGGGLEMGPGKKYGFP